jgi:hypothetical protein
MSFFCVIVARALVHGTAKTARVTSFTATSKEVAPALEKLYKNDNVQFTTNGLITGRPIPQDILDALGYQASTTNARTYFPKPFPDAKLWLNNPNDPSGPFMKTFVVDGTRL